MLTWSPRFSFASHLMGCLGRRFIAKPAALGVPDDWYAEPGDREMPNRTQATDPSILRARIRSDAIRRALSERVAVVGAVLTLVACGVLLATAGAISGLSGSMRSPEQVEADIARCAQLSSLGAYRSPAQTAELRRVCRRR